MKRQLLHELVRWKNNKEHLPILLRGARQVGKSFLVAQFGKEFFEDLAVIDFELHPEYKSVFKTRDPAEILAQLELVLRKAIRPGRSLLFLDEIQGCPEALIALRYFKEKMPDLHVIAAGSLLEFLLKEENFSFPVGRVEFLYLRPFSFLEYLIAVAPFVAERMHCYSLTRLPTEIEHKEFLKWVRRYLFIGGMPSSILASLNQESLLDAQRVHYRILQAYESDFGKYANHAQHRYLHTVFQKAPVLVTQILKYKRLDEETRSRELKPAIELLCHAGLLQRIFATTASGLPLHAHMKEDRFKLLYLDVGLLQTATRTDATHFFEQEILQINAGMIAEQFVGQELIASAPFYQNEPLLFWEKTNGGQAEVDFVLSIRSEIIPVEVKAGATGALRSLHSFMQEKKSRLGIRISEKPLSFQDNILSVPFYLINSLDALVKEIL